MHSSFTSPSEQARKERDEAASIPNCPCGGRAAVQTTGSGFMSKVKVTVQCIVCGLRTRDCFAKRQAIELWQHAFGKPLPTIISPMESETQDDLQSPT